MTSHYNGYFNAKEIYKGSVASLSEGHEDNYNRILEMYPYVATDNEKSVDGDMETAIQKISVVVKLHREGDWTDDCYLLMGQCRYLQKDYEGAEEAFKFLTGEYNLDALEKRKQARKKKKKKSSKKKKGEIEPEKYFLTKRPAYEDGMIWMARTFVERGKYDDADLVLLKLKNDKRTHEDMIDDMAEVKAYSYLKRKDYENAVEPLKELIELTKRRKSKARYTYILAQIHQLAGRSDDAYAGFNQVLKLAPAYDMEFNARLSMLTNAWSAGKESSPDVIRKLNRMAKDSKNKEYRDRIYFTLAQIHLKEEDKNEAIVALRQSLKYNIDNKAQKAESYLLLGDLYYDSEEYVNSKNYFDSTLVVMNQGDERRDRVERMSANLSEIAENITIIETQDSLLAVGMMSEEDRRLLAAKILKEREKQAAEAAANTTVDINNIASGPTNTLGASKSNFFAYNDRELKRGKRSFENRWGSRTLQDNWRRSSGSQDDFGEEVSEEDYAESLSKEQLDDVFKGVPFNDETRKAANEKIRVAMFKLGVLFRDKIQNHGKAVETLEDLLARYPDTSDKLEAYYNLYLAHTDLKNKPRAKYYYDKITNEFPNTTYARVLNDPNFLAESNKQEKELTKYYDQTYTMFRSGNYQKALERTKEADVKFGNKNKLKPKFALVGAMCIGSIDGKDAYKTALKEVIAKYPDTEEQTKAKEILRYLEGGKITVAPPIKPGKPGDKPDGDKPTDPNKPDAVGDDKGPKGTYAFDMNKAHYFIAVLDSADDLKKAKENINAYNKENFLSLNLRANSIYLGTSSKTPMLVVRRFGKGADAMEYYNKVAPDVSAAIGEGIKVSVYVISQTNYREVLKNKGVGGYAAFFEENYLK